MYGDGGIDQIAAKGSQTGQNAVFVGAGKPGISNDIRDTGNASVMPCRTETASTRRHYERVERYGPFADGIDDNRIEIDLANRRFVEQEATDGVRDPDDRVDIERHGTAKAFEQGGPLKFAELL